MGIIYKGSEDQGGPFWGFRTRAGASCTFWGCMMHMVGGGGISCGPTNRALHSDGSTPARVPKFVGSSSKKALVMVPLETGRWIARYEMS